MFLTLLSRLQPWDFLLVSYPNTSQVEPSLVSEAKDSLMLSLAKVLHLLAKSSQFDLVIKVVKSSD